MTAAFQPSTEKGMDSITFQVFGRPEQCGSKTPGQTKDGRLFVRDSNKNAKTWRRSVEIMAKKSSPDQPWSEPVVVTVEFRYARPKYHFRSNGELKPNAPVYVNRKPDIDKIVRNTLDGLTGYIFDDDKQVIGIKSAKVYSEKPGATITIKQVKDGVI